MKSPTKPYRTLLITTCLVFLMLGSATAADRLTYMGSSVILRTFFIDAAKAFDAKTGTNTIYKAEMTPQGIAGLLKGQCDIAGGGRPLKDAELSKGLNEIPFASNIITVFVNKNNPVDNLSSKQLKDIFAGKITNWKEVGGSDNPIMLIIDPPKALHRKNFTRIAMADETIYEKNLTVKKPPQTVAKVAKFQYSISYTSLGLVKKDPNVKPISIDGAKPIPDNVANQSYKLFMTMYFYTMGEPKGKVKELVDFLVSAEGKQIISNGGMYPF